MSNCDCQKSDCHSGSTSGFIFGLICGAVIGAVIAVIVYKNNKTEVFEKLQQQIKDFFEKLTGANINNHQKPKSKKSSQKIKPLLLATSLVPPKPTEIVPIFVKPKKSVPKTFIKPKK